MAPLRVWLISGLIAAVVAFGAAFFVVSSQNPAEVSGEPLVNYGER